MAEYIDREAVKEIMKKYRCLDCTNEKSLDCPLCQLHIPFTEISKIPTADVVEVVRCKDCLYFEYQIGSYGICKHWHTNNQDIFDLNFCGYAEPRTPKKKRYGEVNNGQRKTD